MPVVSNPTPEPKPLTPSKLESRRPVHGSRRLLEGLWTPEELAGRPEELISTPPGEAGPEADPPDWAGLRSATPSPPPEGPGLIRRVDLEGPEKLLALTFDLCERADNRAGYDHRIVDLLRREEIPATFFAGGKWLRSHPERSLQLLADPLFELGSHAWSHGNLALMDSGEREEQVLGARAQYGALWGELARRAEENGLGKEMDLVPRTLGLFRPPYGRGTPEVLEHLHSLGHRVIQWDVEGEEDGERHSPEDLARRALAAVRPGSIVLMHANAVPRNTHALLPLLLEGLRGAGYGLVAVSELLTRGRPVCGWEGYFSRPGDNLYCDGMFPAKGTRHPRPENGGE